MWAKILLILIACILLPHLLGLTRRRRALRAEYLSLLSEARILLSQYSVRSWPEVLAKWERKARFAPWMLLQHFAKVTKSKLGGMGSLGDVVIFRDGKSEEKANNRFLEIVGALYVVTTKIAG